MNSKIVFFMFAIFFSLSPSIAAHTTNEVSTAEDWDRVVPSQWRPVPGCQNCCGTFAFGRCGACCPETAAEKKFMDERKETNDESTLQPTKSCKKCCGCFAFGRCSACCPKITAVKKSIDAIKETNNETIYQPTQLCRNCCAICKSPACR